MHSFYVPDDFLVRLIGAVHLFQTHLFYTNLGSGSRVLPMIEFGYHINHMTTRHVSIVRVSVFGRQWRRQWPHNGDSGSIELAESFPMSLRLSFINLCSVGQTKGTLGSIENCLQCIKVVSSRAIKKSFSPPFNFKTIELI
jgi:hypothetical protein